MTSIKTFLTGLFFLTTLTLVAQDIKLKDNIAYADGTPAYSFEKTGMNGALHLYKLNTKEEILTLEQKHLGFDSGPANNYVSFTFPGQNITLTSKALQHNNWKFLISLLLTEKVLDLRGAVDMKNLQRFQQKYDEKITSK